MAKQHLSHLTLIKYLITNDLCTPPITFGCFFHVLKFQNESFIRETI